ncbi:MAG TPA: hypothetical protein GX711_06955 [Clostridia bacterium]|nr:hypothetical protein [Clostridia bacterium]
MTLERPEPFFQTYPTPQNETEEASATFISYLIFIITTLVIILGANVFS